MPIFSYESGEMCLFADPPKQGSPGLHPNFVILGGPGHTQTSAEVILGSVLRDCSWLILDAIWVAGNPTQVGHVQGLTHNIVDRPPPPNFITLFFSDFSIA